jgi:hypothetical protein
MINVAQLLREHVALDVECVDRLYLNGYVPKLQTPQGLTAFMKYHLGKPVPSPALLSRLTSSFCNDVESFIAENDIPLVHFKRRQRKDDLANAMRAERGIRDGVVFVGVAQEKASAFKGRKVGQYEFDYSRADVFVKHYYFYIDDADFGPGFIKVCTYAPFAVRVCLNGHEWVKRQLTRRGIAFEELDNGFLSVGDPDAVQTVCDRLSSFHIEDFFRKWADRLPFPLNDHARRAGYRHRLSIWQMEFSRTQVFPQPIRGRQFFESVIRENLDLGRPERVKLVFDRQVRKNTPGRFATRVVTNGVHPSIHISYKNTELKQYFKLNRALLSRQNRILPGRSWSLVARCWWRLPETSGQKPATTGLRRAQPVKGVIAKVPGTTRYFLTHYGYRVALFVTRVHARVLRPGFACVGQKPDVAVPHPLRTALNRVGVEVDHLITQAALRAAA